MICRDVLISNVQIKPNSRVPFTIKDAVFKGFLSRVYTVCSPQYLKAEIDFLKTDFTEN